MEINREKKTVTITQNTGITLSVALVVMLAGGLFTIATWVADQRNRLTITEGTVLNIRADVTKLQAESTDSRIKYTEIQTQLKSIDATLLEIKERLK